MQSTFTVITMKTLNYFMRIFLFNDISENLKLILTQTTRENDAFNLFDAFKYLYHYTYYMSSATTSPNSIVTAIVKGDAATLLPSVSTDG